MRMLVISDIHGSKSMLKRVIEEARKVAVDLVVVCGDITDFGSLIEAKRVLRMIQEVGKTVFVPGNCDPPTLLSVSRVGAAYQLHCRRLTVKGVTFAGLGGSNITPFSTPIEFCEGELANMLGSLKVREGEVDVCVFHCPPANTKCDRVYSGGHVGSSAIRQFVEEKKPKLVLCGHIHESKALDKLGDTLLINPGAVYQGHYTVVEVNAGEVKVLVNK